MRTFSSVLPLSKKISLFPWSIFFLLVLVAAVGFLVLYSAAGGSFLPWTLRQVLRFLLGAAILLLISFVDIRFWMKQAYLIYGMSLLLLVGVEVMGFVGMGAQRWINLHLFYLQPSELMKLSLVLALARYFQFQGEERAGYLKVLLVPAFFILFPALLVMRQPDLGTAMVLLLVGGCLLFAAGVRLWVFASLGAGCLAALPVLWSLLREYQKKRILIFLDPEKDPLGAGYHILQSKIALGSGGLWGKGFMAGTQSHLDFLPEKQTDFIFTMLCEEFGMVGGGCLLGLYALTLILCYRIVFQARFLFSRLLALGVATIFFLHIFINAGMVMGILPVVGVPLPLMSYGGTSMLTLLMGFGFLFCVDIHRETRLSRSQGFGD